MALDFWRKSTPQESIPEMKSQQECDTLLANGRAILFKHSPTCAVSWAAHRQVLRFQTAHPDALVYLVSVRRQRELSWHIAAQTGIEHQSPQIIVVSGGKIVVTASHAAITADLLASAWQQG